MWLAFSYFEKVTYKPVTGPQRQKRKNRGHASFISTININHNMSSNEKPFIKSSKPSLLSFVPGYCDEYKAKSTDLPTPLSELLQREI